MARRCTVCDHPKRAQLDRELAERTGPLRRIAAEYGLAETSLRRHEAEHLPAKLAKAAAAREVTHADALLGEVERNVAQLRELYTSATAVLETARASGDHTVALRAIDTATRCHGQSLRYLETLLRVAGELRESAPSVSVVFAGQWVEVRGVLLRALEPFPAARSAVVEALAPLEAGGHE